jgi:YegS/Rv2252/BmrU family lipid kinase
MNKTLVIVNPWAGRGKAGRHLPEIEQELQRSGADFEVQTTHARGGAIELAWRGTESRARCIVAVGGDGTINEVVNGLKGAEAKTGYRPQLAILPLGTGSDFVKVFDTIKANDVKGGIQRALSGQPHQIDLGLVRINAQPKRFFINALGVGFDAQAAAEALKIRRVGGFMVYILAIGRALMRYRAHPMTVEYGGKRVTRQLLFTSVANGRCQAGGFWLTPHATVDDGLLDLCLVDNMRLHEIARHIPKVLAGRHTRLRQVTMGRAEKVRITCSAPMPVATDGEVLATDARRIQVEVLPHALEILL